MFKAIIIYILRPLTKLNLSSSEKLIVQESMDYKYIPTLRHSVIGAILGTPGILLSESGQSIAILAVVASVAGIAWFTISLKEVKEKFSSFGIQVTANMLEAFLMTIFIIALTSAYSIVIATTNIDSLQRIVPTSAQWVFAFLTLLVGTRITWKLVLGTIQHDANDAMLTGSSDLAKRYYGRSLSSFTKAAALLRNEHSIDSANLTISSALQDYFTFLLQNNLAVPDRLEKSIEYIVEHASGNQDEIDKKVIPVLQAILTTYKPFVSQDIFQLSNYTYANKVLLELESHYSNNSVPSQNLADSSIAIVIDAIAAFLEEYQDKLETTSNS